MANEETADNNDQLLYRHSRRPEWGVAALISAQNGRRSYQFADGTLRTLKEEFCGLMEPVHPEHGTGEQLHTDLEALGQQMLARKRAGRHSSSSKSNQGATSRPPVMNLTQQVQVFKQLYPGGFQDTEYIDKIRGESGGRQRKRLRTPAIESAQSLLAADALRPLVEQQQTDKVVERLRRTLQGTDLVRMAQDVRPLSELSIVEQDRIASALYDLLHGSGTDAERLAAWCAALDAVQLEVTWATMTAPLALVHPAQHLPVRGSVFALQARLLAPEQHLSSKPSPTQYGWIRDMAQRLEAHLKQVGETPRDLMDVYEFIWLTLRPNGQKVLKALSS